MRLVIEERHAGKPAREEALLAEHASAIGMEVVGMTWKPFVRNRVKPLPDDIVAGSVAFVRSALQSLGKQLPPPDPYPERLIAHRHRRVWLGGPLKNVLAQFDRDGNPVFIKPAKRWKLFTGFVLAQPNPAELHGISRSEPVWCADPVRFVSEWRCYVVHGSLAFMGMSDFGGDRNRKPDPTVIDDALAFYHHGPAGYAIDFGVLDTGETALIEVNDGFSVGAYDGIPAATYFAMVEARWKQLVA